MYEANCPAVCHYVSLLVSFKLHTFKCHIWLHKSTPLSQTRHWMFHLNFGKCETFTKFFHQKILEETFCVF